MSEQKITSTPSVKWLSDVGTSEPFMARIAVGLPRILNATSFPEKKKISDGILHIIFDALEPAYINLKELRECAKEPSKYPEMVLKEKYYGLYNRLWAAYKDRMQTVIKLLGFDIGFLFKKEKDFEKGCVDLINKHPNLGEEFITMLKDERQTWQTLLSKIRNDYLEHKKIGEKEVAGLFTLESAEIMFQNCWEAIEEILVQLLWTGLPLPDIDIAQIPHEKRDPSVPERFGFVTSLKLPQE